MEQIPFKGLGTTGLIDMMISRINENIEETKIDHKKQGESRDF